MYTKSFSNALRTLRLDRRLTQTDVASAAGITPAFLDQLERGTRSASTAVCQALCVALRVAPCDLLDHPLDNPPLSRYDTP